MASKKLFDLIEYENLAMLLLFVLFGIMIYKRINKARETFESIDNDDLGGMLSDIDSLDFTKLKEFEDKLKNKESQNEERSKKFGDIIGSNEIQDDFLPVDLDQSFDDLIDDEVDDEIDDEEIEDEMKNSKELNVSAYDDVDVDDEDDLEFGFIKKTQKPKFEVGQLLMKSDVSKIKDIIEDETEGPIDDRLISKAEELIADEHAHRMIGEKKVLDQSESGFLNKLLNVRDGIDKIQTNVRKIKKIDLKDKVSKLSDKELDDRFKKNNVGIFDKPSLSKLIDKSDKMFKYDLDAVSGGQPVGLDEESIDFKELDSEEPVTIRPKNDKPKFEAQTLEDSMVRPGKYGLEKDSLVLDEEQYDEARYLSINEIDGPEEDSVKYLEPDSDALFDIEKEENIIQEPDDLIESEVDSDVIGSIIDNDEELSSIYDKNFKNPVNVTPIDDNLYEKRLVDLPEPDCTKDGSCSYRKNKKKSFTIDKEGVESRLHTNVKSGTFIEPTYIDDITNTQMKLDDSRYDLEISKLNDLRKTKKYNGAVKMEDVYNDSIPKPNKKNIKNNLAQNNMDVNKSHSNYYSFNPNAPIKKHVASDSITAFDGDYSSFSKY